MYLRVCILRGNWSDEIASQAWKKTRSHYYKRPVHELNPALNTMGMDSAIRERERGI